MADVTRNVTIRLKVEQVGGAFKMPDMTAVQKAAADIEAEYTRAFDNIEKKAKEASARMASVANSGSSVTATVSPGSPGKNSPTENGTTSEVVGKLRIAGDAYKVAGEGAFHLARGVALLNIESETELAQVVKKIAYYQGVFDIFKGGVDVTKGLIVGTRAVAAAYSAAAIATTAATGATSACTIAMNIAATTATRMWLAITGPVGLAVIGLTAVAAAAAYLWHTYGGAAEAAAEKMRKAVAHTLSMRDAQNQLAAATRNSVQASLEAEKLKRSRDFNATDATSSAQDQLAQIEADRKRMRDSRDRGTLAARVEAEAYARTVGRRDAALTSKGTKEEKVTALDRQAEKEKAAGEYQLALLNKSKDAIERELDLRQQKLTILDKEKSRLQDMLKLEEDRYKTAQDQLKTEAQRNLSGAEKFGRMNPFEQQQAKDIAAKVKAGGVESLREDEIRFLEDKGLGEGKVSRNRINKGNAAGYQDVAGALGEGEFTPQEAAGGAGPEGMNRAKEAQRMADAALESSRDSTAQMAEVIQQVAQERKEFESVLEKVGDISTLTEVVKNAILERDRLTAQLKDELNKSKAEQAALKKEVDRRNMGTR